MNNRNLLNLGLLIFIVIVAAIAIYDSEDDSLTKNPITSLTKDDIDTIIIKRKDKVEIHLKKQHNQWRLTQPYNTATNQFRMDTLLRLVETVPHSTYSLEDTSAYGLNDPKLEVHFNLGKNNAETIKFGDSEPIKLRRYVSVGNKLHITNDTYFYALTSVATDYISHKLLPTDFKIKKLELPKLKLEIKDERWKVTPEQENFSIDNVNELINEWNTAQSIDIKPYKGKINISNKNTIKLYGEDASTFTFNILKDDKEFILVDTLIGLQYSFPLDKKIQLLNLPAPVVNEEDALSE